jgi:histidine triad (HIT) family protein
VYSDDAVVGFFCEPPAAWGHVLVVPREHVDDIWDIDPGTFQQVAAVSHRIAGALRAAVGAEGINIRQNSREIAGQDVFHFHMHVIPRYEGDALGPFCVWKVPPWAPPAGGDERRAEVAEAIRAALTRM